MTRSDLITPFFPLAVTPGALPLRVDKRIGSEWRVMAWCGDRDAARSLIENGLGGVCRVVDVPAREWRRLWREVNEPRVEAA